MEYPILKMNQVVKQYGNHTAVDAVSFEVPKGSVFGLLGPNGAGKTSLIRIITTITRADSGVIELEGQLLNSSHPEQIGYMPEERGLYKKMKVGAHLIYLARLKGLSKQQAKEAIGNWMEKFEITDWWNKKVEELSKGMQQKVQFIATVVHEPKLLILDEPFSGLDPINTNLIKEEIRSLHKKGTSIIFSTHRMEQVEEICENILLINRGKVLLTGSVKEVKNQFKLNHFEIGFEGELPTELSNQLEVVRQENNKAVVKLPAEMSPSTLLKKAVQTGLDIRSWNEMLPSLNEIFIRQVENNHG
ncbi:MAG: ABC transporter ATP-binding protein [Saprospiraceae bacterium]